MTSFEVFCGVFAVLSYRAIFHSERPLSLGSILMLVALSAAVTQLFTSRLVDSVSDKLFSGSVVEGDGTHASESQPDSAQQTDLKSVVLRQMSSACSAAELGVWGSMLCKQFF